MKRLQESLPVELRSEVTELASKFLQSQMVPYDGTTHKYPDLAVWLGVLRSTGMIHHTHHWQTKGKSFYGDHLLFERFYKAIEDEVDVVGEKLSSLDTPNITNYFVQTKHILEFMRLVSEKIPLIQISLASELLLIEMGEQMSDRLEQDGLFTKGLENMMGDILDRHEGHVYLLQQRNNMSS